MKAALLLSLGITLITSSAFAQMRDEDCDPGTQDCSVSTGTKLPNPDIFPYKPLETSYLQERIAIMTENPNFMSNIEEMDRRGLQSATSQTQPWGGSFWPIFQGGIANTYQAKDQTFFVFTPLQNLLWQANYKDWKKRKEKVYPKVYDLSEDELAKLAPSEKYDLLLGDTSFDLTNRVWNHTKVWGEEKKWGYLTKIDMPEGYRLPEVQKTIAFWEGICHGWAVGSGYTPRPEKTIQFTLPNGKKMAIFPTDIKALVSMMWAHSNIQDNVLFEGNRCNKKNPDRDVYGRYIDVEIDKADQTLIPRCGDAHPAIFHVSLVNVMGVEKRPIVLDHNAKLPIANQPVGAYEYTYFNPLTGKKGTLAESMITKATYGAKDPFQVSRNPEATHIVGVAMNTKYVDWQLPKKHTKDSEKDDKVVDNKFMYDLEINANGMIIGGQWRVEKKMIAGKKYTAKNNQIDYFWLAPRDWKKYFGHYQGLPEWKMGDVLPPADFQIAAKVAHGFVYEESEKFFGYKPQCKVFNDKREMKSVDCEFRIPKPQPLVNVVDRLVELSRQ